ncbi:hypothetical protein [uncultured Mediterranean phage uvDeep-CGR0-AD1-C123]|nr:hypothetical protein [uncultured Mediterranean phage uvDeep-CGR0-AD1-C123]
MDTQKGYSVGYEAGLDAIDQIHTALGDNNPLALKDALAGMMVSAMSCAYAFAPTEEVAEELISTAQQFALKNWEQERERSD